MPVDALPDLVDLVRRLQLLPPPQLAELTGSLAAAFPQARALAGELVRRGWLTPYQINQIFLGRGAGLVLGPYVVLERLGEGGMGTVFKARHQKLGRVVAVKLIRKDRLAHPDAIRRFYREVQAAAQLEHPHIVRAYDAGEAGGAHFFVMEHVEGTDLARHVKRHGPPSVERACDYARQAALGLQHAFERGMVHRDVKPANLLLAAKGDVVKVLDMGLARLDRPEADAGASSTLTREGVLMGTPDYIAPEQARDSHTADIRADLYSLGCTLYFLLTGRAPFPGGSLTEKLLKHQLDEPRPVEELRPETPPAVTAVVRKLMAKRPEDRYQTPAEAAAALASVPVAPAAAPVDAHALTDGVAVGAPPAPRDGGETMEPAATEEVVRRAAERLRRRAAEGRRRLVLYGVAGLLSLGVGVLALVLVIRLTLPPPVAPATPVAPPPTPPVAPSADEQVKAVADELKKRNPKFDGKVTPTVENGVVVGLEFLTDDATDITPVRALAELRTLKCGGSWGKGRLSNLWPLKDMKLTYLDFAWSQVSDLSPLRDMELTTLGCWYTPMSDLSPLKNMPLISVNCDFHPWRDTELLRSIPTLTKINEKPAADFWKEVDAQRAEFDAWCKQVAAMKADEQVEAVKAELKKRNPTFNGDVKPTIENGVVIGLEFVTDEITDIAPVRALAGLQTLKCGGGNAGKGRLADLSPLKDMKLTSLWCDHTPVSDLSPLKDIKLWGLNCSYTRVSDLSPLKDVKLTDLRCGHTTVSDLSPLKDMKLTFLSCRATPVSDLSPLKDMKLTFVDCFDTKVSDLSPLKDMPLTELRCDFKPERDAAILRSLKTLQTINGKPAVEFWKEFDSPAPPKP